MLPEIKIIKIIPIAEPKKNQNVWKRATKKPIIYFLSGLDSSAQPTQRKNKKTKYKTEIPKKIFIPIYGGKKRNTKKEPTRERKKVRFSTRSSILNLGGLYSIPPEFIFLKIFFIR